MSADGYLLLSIDAIRIEDRLRSVDPDRVGALAASISELGQLQPVGVAPDENGYILVDGEHRIAALRLLGRTEVAAIVREQSPEQRERAEIHSNLVRSDLTQLDRAIFIGRLADLYGLIVDPGARRGGDRRSANVREKDQFANIANWSSFARKTAERTGLGQRSIYAARELARAITPETAALLRGTPVVDNAAQLRQLMDLPEEDRLAVARQLAAGTAKNVRGARVAAGLLAPSEAAPARQVVDRLMAAIERLDADATQLFAADVRSWLARREAAATQRATKRAQRQGDA